MVTDEALETSHAAPWLSRPVGLLIAARAVNQMGAFSISFLAVLLVRRYGVDVATAGLVVAAFGVATVPSRLAGGRITRHLGARTTIVLGLVSCASAQLAIAFAPDLAVVVAATVLLGLAFEVYEPPSQALLAELTASRHRARVFSLFGAALALGGVAGGLLASLVGGVDLRWLFVVDAGSCVSCAAVVRLGLVEDRVATVPPGASTGGRPWRDRRLLTMLMLGSGFAILLTEVTVALPLTLVARGIPAPRYGLVLAVSSLVVVAAQPLLGLASVQAVVAEPFRAMAFGYVLLAVGFAATGLVDSVAGFVAATVPWALGDVLLLALPFAVVADLAPPGTSASYLAAFGTCWGVGAVVAPILGTAVLAHAGPSALWLGCAAAALLLAAVQGPSRLLVRG